MHTKSIGTFRIFVILVGQYINAGKESETFQYHDPIKHLFT